MELNFEKLISNVWKLAIVLVAGVSESAANKPMELGTAISFLVISSVNKGLAYKDT
ncbi:MAG: hypothetical protein ABSE79_00535 [Terriglobia bacterium]